MRVGALLLPTDPWPETVALVRDLEAMGFDHLWTYDHLSWRRYRERPWFSALPWLAGVAGVTQRIGIGTLVSSPNVHHPAVLAKEAMTIDHVSGGRLTLGLGVGGLGFDATVLGREPLSAADRVSRFVEFATLVDQLLAAPVASFRGDWYSVVDAVMHPGCAQTPRLPLAVAAGGERTIDVAARVADVWVTYGDTTYRDTTVEGTRRIVRRQVELLDEACDRHRRDPATIRRLYLIGNTDVRPLASVDAFVEFATEFAELGFTDLVFHHPRRDDPVWNEPEEIVSAIAERALPGLRGGGAGDEPIGGAS